MFLLDCSGQNLSQKLPEETAASINKQLVVVNGKQHEEDTLITLLIQNGGKTCVRRRCSGNKPSRSN